MNGFVVLRSKPPEPRKPPSMFMPAMSWGNERREEGGGAALAVSEDGDVGGGEGAADVVWEGVGEGVEDDMDVADDYVDGVGVGGAGGHGGVGWVLDGARG